MVATWSIVPLHAVDPDRALSQYVRDRWESSNGFPGGPVYAITQSVDGYLWIATEKGLVRFDGLSYRLVQPMELTSGSDSAALALAPDPAGGLWARLRRAAFVRFRNGAFENVIRTAGVPNSRVTAMGAGNDDTILIVDASQGLIAGRAGRFNTVVAANAMPRSLVTSIAQTSNSDIWLGTRDSGLVRIHAGQAESVTSGLAEQKINCLVNDADAQLWIGTDNGVFRWSLNGGIRTGLPAVLSGVRALTMARDRDGNVWIATPDALLRVSVSGVASLEHRTRGRSVTALFEDRDGNLWIGTSSGIERWRDGVFTFYSDPGAVVTGNAGPIFADSAERVWFAPSSGGLSWLRAGRTEHVTAAGLSNDVVYSIAGHGDDVWIGRQHGGLTHLRAHGDTFVARTFTTADGLAQDNVYAVERARDGSVWAGTLSSGASRFKDGVFTTFTTADGLPSSDVNTLFEDSAHNVWVGTSAGLAVVRDGRVDTGLQLPERLQQSTVGVVEDSAGGLWIATADHVFRVDRNRLVAGSIGSDGLREFDAADGLVAIEGVKRHRSLSTDSHGSIWLSTNGGFAMASPVRVARRGAPPLVHVDEVSADGSPVNGAGDHRIDPNPRRITLAFSGLSLSVPERVRFRYRLDGFDHDWSEPVSARQAVYTNLGPGAYTFRLIASNSDGVWNSAEAALSFTIAPALWETRWFQASVIFLFTAAGWGAYRMHVRQVARRLHLRFDERLAERTRIARELHDTLLQSFHAVLFRFQAAANMLPGRPVEAREQFESAIDQAAQAIAEGRDAVQNLRSSAVVTNDLAVAISALGEELAAGQAARGIAGNNDANASPTVVDVAIEGAPRHLHPILRDDVYRIAGEALRNAFRHARARRIEVEIHYDEAQLRLRVRDNGQGIDPSMHGQPPGHFGLAGMRERAELVGGRLDVWSEVGVGTEVDLTIPAAAAYADPGARGRSAAPAERIETPADQSVLAMRRATRGIIAL